MLATLLIALAAQALPAAPPPAAGQASPAAPPAAAAPPRLGRQQIFMAPSGEEFRAPAEAPYPVADWFAGADANHDGKLTDAEFVADFLRYFSTLDLDHDGVVDSVELERYETEMASELHTSTFAGDYQPSSDEGGDDSGQNRRSLGSYLGADDGQGAGRFDLLRIPEPVASMDVDLKGRIKKDEARDAAEYRFSLLDTQHHGYLMLAELPETYAQGHHGEGHGKRSGGKRGGHGGRGGGHGRPGGMGGGGMGGGEMGGGGGMGAPGY